MQGLLLIDKPAGWTSFDAVNYIRKIVAKAEGKRPKQVKVGHTGTLDPFATGLLVILIGKEYTKKAGELSKTDKTYEVTMRLGSTSSTGDPEGEITPAQAVSGTAPAEKALLEALKRFTGRITQTPPAYSAVKIDGQRAYKLARAGKKVKIEPREVTVNRLELVDYAYPEVKLVADVSSGTYIRSLVEDIGDALGVGAYTTALRRTRVDGYDVQHAVNPKNISSSNITERLRTL
ncbi:MAG TPA: tRNA pseudouridine(55) synthase TruB [Candidatus Saccharimonadales bacterium]|nr:tRNA pseudouridine(55) synthase TruB [Candidatus Saccharimonadales bacterium]